MNETSEKRVKRCWVCGDVGKGFNYEALSCESCKVFFHRNAANQKKLKCRKGGNCEIDFATRKSCTSCRLEKCFRIGMKWKALEENIAMQENILANASNDLRNLLEMETENMIMSTYQTKVFPVKSFVRKKKYATNLNKQEKELINELHNSMDHFEDETKLNCVGTLSDLKEVCNLPANYIARIVKFVKKISAFKLIPQEDQILILKQFFMEFLCVRFCFLTDVEQDGHVVLGNSEGTFTYFIKMETFDKLKTSDTKLDKTRELTKKFVRDMEADTTIMNLITAQYLFRHRDGISCQEYMKYHYFLYCRLLRRYLEHKHKRINLAIQKYSKIMRTLNNLNSVNENMPRMFKQVELAKISNILVEIYDLDKQQQQQQEQPIAQPQELQQQLMV